MGVGPGPRGGGGGAVGGGGGGEETWDPAKGR